MFDWIKKIFPINKILEGNVMGGYGLNGAKPRPFNYASAIRKLNSWIYAGVMLNANAFATQKLRLYVRKKAGLSPLFATRSLTKQQRNYLSGEAYESPSNIVCTKLAEWSSNEWMEVVQPHPILTVRGRPNPEMNGFSFSQLKAIYLQCTGNSYEIPVVNEALGRPVASYMIPSQWVEVVPATEKENSEFFISGYSIGTSSPKFFGREQVIHYRDANPGDDIYYYGYGKIQALWSAIGLHEAKRVEDIARKDNFSRPDWLIGSRTPVDQASIDRLSADLRKQVKGVKKAGNFAALGFDFRAEALNLPDSTIGDPDRLVEEVASVLGVPVNKLLGNHGLAGGQAESGDANHLRDTILPMLRADEESLNNSWIPLFKGVDPDDVCLAYDNPVGKDREFELRKSIELFNAGITKLKETRLGLNLSETAEEDGNE